MTRDTENGDSPGSSKVEDTGEPEMFWEKDHFTRMHKQQGSEAMTKIGSNEGKGMHNNNKKGVPKPYSAPTERIPTIGEQWAYAARRYSKYQGYAWSGVVLVGGLAYLMSLVGTTGEAEPPKGSGSGSNSE